MTDDSKPSVENGGLIPEAQPKLVTGADTFAAAEKKAEPEGPRKAPETVKDMQPGDGGWCSSQAIYSVDGKKWQIDPSATIHNCHSETNGVLVSLIGDDLHISRAHCPGCDPRPTDDGKKPDGLADCVDMASPLPLG